MEKINIIYLHGFGSSGNSSKPQHLRNYYNSDKFNIISPTLSVNPKKAISEITNLVSKYDNLIIVGTSLGGFYADYFNKLGDIPVVLINPLIDVENMSRHIGTNTNYATQLEYEYSDKDFDDLVSIADKKNEFGYNGTPAHILVAKDDETCDWRIAQLTYKSPNQHLQVFPGGGHRFNDMDAITDSINGLIFELNGHDFASLHNNKQFESLQAYTTHLALNERFLNLFTPTDKQKWYKEVENLIIKTYEPIGGYKGDIKEFMGDEYFWKLIRKEGIIVAGRIYKQKVGRKSACAFTNGTPGGKVNLKLLMKDDLTRSWVEVSGGPENVYKYSLQETPLPHSIVQVIMDEIGKEVMEWNEDGYHYTRMIGGEAHEKAIYGRVDLKKS